MGHGPIQLDSSRHDRMLSVIREHAGSMLRLARQHSLCADDAQDAYQRALEIYIERADRVEHATVGPWLRTVVRHEAMAIRAARQRALPSEDVDFDGYPSLEASEGEERALSFERVARSAEALRECKRDEATALFLKAEGNSYADIGRITGWSYTKVNRCLAEGRARFLKAYAAIETGEACERWMPVLSEIVDGEAAAADVAAVRPHLRNCPGCRATLRELYESQPQLGALLPAGFVAAAGAGEGAGLLVRVYEAVTQFVGERAAAVQGTVDAISSGKVAAVAASAAALAGGGVAVERAADEPASRGRPATAQVRAVKTPAASTVVPTSTPTVLPRSTRPARTSAGRSSPPRRARKPARVAEFGFEVVRAPRAPAKPAAAKRRPAPEFGFER